MEKKIKQEILKRLWFFRHFSYFPLEDELYWFLRIKASKKEYFRVLKGLVKKGKIKILKVQGQRLFLEPVNLKAAKRTFLYRVGEYKRKLFDRKFQIYLKILKGIPQIKFIGLSGTLAWEAGNREDDIDLFIISQKGRLWTSRFLAVVLAFLLGIKRKRGEKKAPGKVCLNLFFDEGDLKVPEVKRNEYVAFELLALKPLFDKGVYRKLLQENKTLIKRYFPNFRFTRLNVMQSGRNNRIKVLSFLGDFLESVLKKFQLFLINRHKTREIVTSTQLWFFPEDFEEKYKKLVASSKKLDGAGQS